MMYKDVMLKTNIHSDQPDNKTFKHSVKDIDQNWYNEDISW